MRSQSTKIYTQVNDEEVTGVKHDSEYMLVLSSSFPVNLWHHIVCVNPWFFILLKLI